MPTILLSTEINAPIERCFDLARSIDFHQHTAGYTQETAINGITSGLINLNETVTWKAKHFGLWQQLTVRIIEMEAPVHFRDVLLQGGFARLDHSHRFEFFDGKTIMRDIFQFESPLGILGVVADQLFLKAYMTRFLKERNRILKAAAESDLWKQYLKQQVSENQQTSI